MTSWRRLHAKGKSEPLPTWQAIGPIARRGVDTHAAALSPLVGRADQLAGLAAVFDEVSKQKTPRFVLVTGEPGMGKSRLVQELFLRVDSLPEMTTWRQGHCPPFGEDVTYRALSDIVKMHAGIRDTDHEADVEAKLAAVTQKADGAWVRERLRALVGLPSSDASREESHAAWTRFLLGIADTRPAVLVFEDLHWADDALLKFLEQLVERMASVPLLVVATARPELFERAPSFAGGGQVDRIDLRQLTTEEAAGLAGVLLSGERATAVDQIVERCAGNPFFIEQSVRLLADSSASSLPDSVQAVIAARLDRLPPAQKALIGKAAVVGSPFWGGTLGAMDGGSHEGLQQALSGLLERGLIRRVRESAMEGESEFVFAHALTRDVAYQQLTRATRGRRHKQVADWLGGHAGGHEGDLAEILALHYSTALALAEATGDLDLRSSLVAPLLRSLERAGKRALVLDAKAAERYFGRAMKLVEDEAEGARLLAQWALAVADTGRYGEALPAMDEAASRLRVAGDRRHAAEALLNLGFSCMDMGLPNGLAKTLEAVDLVEHDEPSLEKVVVLYNGSFAEGDAGRLERALELAELAIRTAEEIGLPNEARVSRTSASHCQAALMARGWARCLLGDPEGLDEMREASEAAQSQGSHPLPIVNYAVALGNSAGPLAALPVYARGLEVLHARGLGRLEVRMEANVLMTKWMAGLWDEFLHECGAMEERLEASCDLWSLAGLRDSKALILWARGETETAASLAEWSLRTARAAEVRELIVHALAVSSAVSVESGLNGVARYLEELERLFPRGFVFNGADVLPFILRTMHRVGDVPMAQRLTKRIDLDNPMQLAVRRCGDSLLAEAHGDMIGAVHGYREAAVRWSQVGMPYEEGHALLGQGRCLMALGRAPEAAAPLAAAREIFARLGAKPALAGDRRVAQAEEGPT